MAVLIDTSVFIGVERRGLPVDAAIDQARGEEISLASITASELLTGVHRANTAERRLRREAFVEAILSVVPVLPFDLRVARIHARLAAQLAATGQPIGAHDLLIGATALAYGASVLTVNRRDFDRIPALVVQQPQWL